ncbi:MAG: hypothetical protein FWC75_00105 [Oscillospiraceae bacterium]|nr:hypothetical protein [Oscillospiraceae bacterium]
MEVIKAYIENAFADFPQSSRLQSLKYKKLAEMEFRYKIQIADGKSEHEAIGYVISNFGNIDDICKDIGLNPESSSDLTIFALESDTSVEDALKLSGAEAQAYLEQARRGSSWIGIGVWLIMAGICAMLLIGNLFGDSEAGENGTAGAVGVVVLLLTIAAAVPIFIVNGMRLDRYEHYDDQNLLLDAETKAELERQAISYNNLFAAHLSLGIALILVSLGVFIVLGTLGYRMVPLVIFLLMIGFAVFLFIRTGTTKSAYDVLLGKGDYAKKAKFVKYEKITGTIASVYWPVVVAIYLLWSFVGEAWRISWVVWPVAGVLFGAIAGGIAKLSSHAK